VVNQPPPDALEVFTVTFLYCEGHYLLLQRSPDKSFAPMRWTGLGGHVEPNELASLQSSALREVWEEAGIAAGLIENFTLRRVLLTNRPGPALNVIFYFTGALQQLVQPDCPEGDLFWMDPSDFSQVDIIETTRPVLHCLVDDIQQDPNGRRPVITGLGLFCADGVYESVVWGEAPEG
jgi:8-oxo-dGTP diphosphatase